MLYLLTSFTQHQCGQTDSYTQANSERLLTPPEDWDDRNERHNAKLEAVLTLGLWGTHSKCSSCPGVSLRQWWSRRSWERLVVR